MDSLGRAGAPHPPQWLDEVLHSAADGVTAHDVSGRLVYANGPAVRALGSAGAHLFDDRGRPLAPGELPFLRAFSQIEPVHALLQLHGPPVPGLRWVETRSRVVLPGQGGPLAVTFWRDVTGHLRRREALRRSRARLRSQLAFLAETDALLLAPLDARTLAALVNRLAPRTGDVCVLDLFDDHAPVPRLVRTRVGELVAPCRKLEALNRDEHFLRACAERPWRTALQRVPAGGTQPVWIFRSREELALLRAMAITTVLGLPLQVAGRTCGLLTFLFRSPAGALRGGEVRVLRSVATRLALALETARLRRAADQFLSVAAHELRGPLGSLLAGVQSVRLKAASSTPGPEWLAERLGGIERQARRSARLVQQLFDATLLSTGRLHLVPEPVRVDELIREVVEEVGAEYAHKGVPLEVDAAPLTCACDPDRLGQVLRNLVSNACKYGEGRPVRVHARSDGGEILIEVADEGPGIGAEDQERIFRAFERTDTARGISGLGLGLYVARQIVEACGGRIDLRSAPGLGARFTVHLPARSGLKT